MKSARKQSYFFEIKYKCNWPLQSEPWLVRAAESDLQQFAIPLPQAPFLPSSDLGMERGQRL